MASSVVLKGMALTTPLSTIRSGNLSVANVSSVTGYGVVMKSRDVVCCSLQEDGGGDSSVGQVGLGRREAVASGLTALVAGLSFAGPAFADFEEDYKSETQSVIERVKSTLALDKADPSKSDAVQVMRQTSNDWVAKYRREKSVAGRPSFSNMYSVLNAISGHYISFGPNYPIPAKRKERILEEIRDAEKALKRGR